MNANAARELSVDLTGGPVDWEGGAYLSVSLLSAAVYVRKHS